MNTARSKKPATSFKLLLLGGLYFSQGLPFGFFTQALPVILREHQVSLEKIGLSSLLALPWLLKIFWAPIVDAGPPKRFEKWGHHRSFILPLQFLTIALLVIISVMDLDRALYPLLLAVGLSNLCAATQDVATDSLAVHLLNDDDRSYGNGVQVGAYRAGMIIGGGTLLMFMSSLGWSLTFLSMAILLTLATLPILFLNEREKNRNDPLRRQSKNTHPNSRTPVDGLERKMGQQKSYWRKLAKAFQQEHLGPWLLTLVILKFGDNFATGMVRPFLVDNGYQKADIGWMVGVLGFSASLAGAGLGSLFYAKLNRMRGLLLFSFLQALSVAGYAAVVVFQFGSDVLTAVIVLDHFFGGMATVALFTCMMDTCSREDAGTRFTLQASVVVLGTGLGSAFSGLSAGQFGHEVHFLVGALLSFACVGAAWIGADSYAVLSKKARDTFEHPTDDNETTLQTEEKI